MAFVVEDGTGLTTANAYLSVAGFKAYHTDRGNSWGSHTDPEIQGALVRATDYIDARNGARFKGERLVDGQSLEWPRQYAYYRGGTEIVDIPVELEKATAEYALVALDGVLAPNPTYTDSNAPVKEYETRVGPIVERTAFGGGGLVSSTWRDYPIADALIKPLLAGGGEAYLERV